MAHTNIDRKNERVTLLDGGFGSYLNSNCCLTSSPLMPWGVSHLLNNPDQVIALHKKYIAANCDVITTHSFRTNHRSLKNQLVRGIANLTKNADMPDNISIAQDLISKSWSDSSGTFTKLSILLANLARESFESIPKVRIAASTTTLEDGYKPTLVPADKELYREHSQKLQDMKFDGEVLFDILIIESLNSLRETKIALECALEILPDIPVWISFGLESEFVNNKIVHLEAARLYKHESHRPRSGEELTNVIGDILDNCELFNNLEGMLLNCCSPESITHALHELGSNNTLNQMRERKIQFGAYANIEDSVAYNPREDLRGSGYSIIAANWAQLGAQIIGGCCGTGPEEIRAVQIALSKRGFRG